MVRRSMDNDARSKDSWLFKAYVSTCVGGYVHVEAGN